MTRFNFLTINVTNEQVTNPFQVFLHREQINQKHLTTTMEETPNLGPKPSKDYLYWR